jgi:hypothetical protein
MELDKKDQKRLATGLSVFRARSWLQLSTPTVPSEFPIWTVREHAIVCVDMYSWVHSPGSSPWPAVQASESSLRHTHHCPHCHATATCDEPCSTEFDEDGKQYGANLSCAACANPPSEAFDIFADVVEVGHVVRCDEGLVYSVECIDRDCKRAELVTIIGYPFHRRLMHLASDVRPCRYAIFEGHRVRQPIWFRVRE